MSASSLHVVIVADTKAGRRALAVSTRAALTLRDVTATIATWDEAARVTPVDVALVIPSSADPLVDLVERLWTRRDVPMVLVTDDEALCNDAYEAGVSAVVGERTPVDALIAIMEVARARHPRGAQHRMRGMCRLADAIRAYVARDDAAGDADDLTPILRDVAAVFAADIGSIMLFEDAPSSAAFSAPSSARAQPQAAAARAGVPHSPPALRVVARMGHDAAAAAAAMREESSKRGIAASVARANRGEIVLRGADRERNADRFRDVEAKARPEIAAAMCVPIPSAGAQSPARGVLNIARSREGSVFGPADFELCGSIAGLIGDAIAVVEGRRLTTSLARQVEAAERLSTLGELAGGIVHEVANPVTCVRANVNALIESLHDLLPHLARLEGEPGVDEILDELPRIVCETVEGLERTNDVVREMKALMRASASASGRDVERLFLSEVVQSTVRLLRPRVNAQMVVHVADDIVIDGARSEIQRVLVNLIVNASDACDDRKAATAPSLPEEHDGYRPRIDIELFVEDGHGVVAVSDNGNGMDEKTIARVFQPLFTTKEGARGTGLGLPLVRRVVERHAGEIGVTSQPGRGSTFRVALPLAAS